MGPYPWCLQHNIQGFLWCQNHSQFQLFLSILSLWHIHSCRWCSISDVVWQPKSGWKSYIILYYYRYTISIIYYILLNWAPIYIVRLVWFVTLHLGIALHGSWKSLPGELQAHCRVFTNKSSFSKDLGLVLLAVNSPSNLGLSGNIQYYLQV